MVTLETQKMKKPEHLTLDDSLETWKASFEDVADKPTIAGHTLPQKDQSEGSGKDNFHAFCEDFAENLKRSKLEKLKELWGEAFPPYLDETEEKPEKRPLTVEENLMTPKLEAFFKTFCRKKKR